MEFFSFRMRITNAALLYVNMTVYYVQCSIMTSLWAGIFWVSECTYSSIECLGHHLGLGKQWRLALG